VLAVRRKIALPHKGLKLLDVPLIQRRVDGCPRRKIALPHKGLKPDEMNFVQFPLFLA